MKKSITNDELNKYVRENIAQFHTRRLEKLKELNLQEIIRRKNPYLYKAKNLVIATELVKALLDAFLSSQEEAIFGTFLEGLACFVCERVHGGRKSSAEGIDLELALEGVKYIIAVKSGPSWGNSSQIRRMIDDFKRAKRILGTNTKRQKIIAINGCCYGRDNAEKDDYLKYCGQKFWEFISGDGDFYIDIIEPIGHEAKAHNDAFIAEYAKVVTQLTQKFINEFCEDGKIVWSRIAKLNSGFKSR